MTTQDIVFRTKDNLSIYGTFYETLSGDKNKPGLLLLHQFRSDRSEWDVYAREFTKEGFVVLSIDLRGHGQSDSIPDQMSMLNDTSGASYDVEEAISFLKNHPKVDETRIAVIGGSVGGNLAAFAAGAQLADLGVCISGKTSAVRNLAGRYEHFKFRNTMYVAASQDGKREFYANEMGGLTEGENEILIDSKSKAHGVSMLANPTIKAAILDWIKTHL